MTADRRTRRRNTWLAIVAGLVALLATGALGAFAVVEMADSRAGRDASDDTGRVVEAQRLPWTATALIGVMDDNGRLASSAVAVLDPEGRGGTLTPISSSADTASGTNVVLRPLGAVFEVDGPEAWRAAAEQATGLSFDVAEVIDEERFIQLIGPLGDLPTLFPFAFTDAKTEETFEAGATVLTTSAAYRVITSVNGDGPDWQIDPIRNAVWDAIADRVGAGIGALPDGVVFTRAAPPSGLDQFTDGLFSAPVAFRGLETVQIDPDRVADQLPVEYSNVIGLGWEESVVTLRRGEVVLVFASVAPSRMAAPLEGPTVRMVSGYTDDDAAPLGFNRSDLLIGAIDVLLFTKTNVLSVVDQPGATVPERTTVLVSDAALIDGVWELYGDVFGELDVRVAPVAISGIDAEITLGREYLRLLAEPDTPADDDDSSNGATPETTDVAGSDS
ncbi:MAG: hypothetical protein RIB65_11885 [Ilumatobacter fluminis]|uniref:hypothetical protein n=1 Tax=Ilumatobacter fluminis TaxID=467091 RepID=UPI0032EEE84D